MAMIMTLYSNYNTDDVMSGNNNNNKNSIEFCTIAATSNSARSSSSDISVMVDDDLKWKTIVIPGGNNTSAVTLPRRDFHFKRIEVEEAPKWFVWPKRHKENNKSTRNDKKMMNHGEASSSSVNNISFHPDILLSESPSVAFAMSQNVTNLINANNNLQQNLMGQHNLSHIASTQSRSDNGMIIQPELISIRNSESSSYIMRCHITTRPDGDRHILGSTPTTSDI